jgi:hypothetical protein
VGQSRSGPGISPWRMAKQDGIPYARLRRAIENGEVKVLTFGGVDLITPAERERVRNLLLGVEPITGEGALVAAE